MIITTKEELKQYKNRHPFFLHAFRALAELADGNFATGIYPVDDKKIFINALQYDTHTTENALMEVHKTYIDVMWMISGEENIHICSQDKLKSITKEYEYSGDALLAKLEDDCDVVNMTDDSVCIIFPGEAHAPGIDTDKTHNVKKLIAKVAFDY